MSIEKELKTRSGECCELCKSAQNLQPFMVPPATKETLDQCILICDTCRTQIENPQTMEANHWRCLNDSMWNPEPVVQVVAWRMLNRLRNEGWPAELLDMLYLDDETLAWAKATGEETGGDETQKHRDSNGVELKAGDTVVVIKDLDVKGSSLVAKRGTAVRNIALVHDNPEHIEGRVNGQLIVILTKFVKKS